jgi:hypothetical protein
MVPSSQPLFIQFPISLDHIPKSNGSNLPQSSSNSSVSPRFSSDNLHNIRIFSDASESASSEFKKSLKGGPKLKNLPTYYGRFWDRLHRPTFYHGSQTNQLILYPSYWVWVGVRQFIAFILVLFVQPLTHTGCARMPIKEIRGEIYNNLDDTPEPTWTHRRYGMENYGQSPEITLRSVFETNGPTISQYPGNPKGRRGLVDADGHPLRERLTDKHGVIKKDLDKIYVVIGIFDGNRSDPDERLVRIDNKRDFFRILRHKASMLRRWIRFVSLKAMTEFGLYRVRFWSPKDYKKAYLGDESVTYGTLTSILW